MKAHLVTEFKARNFHALAWYTENKIEVCLADEVNATTDISLDAVYAVIKAVYPTQADKFSFSKSHLNTIFIVLPE